MFVAMSAGYGKFGSQYIQEDGAGNTDGAAARRLIRMASGKVYKSKLVARLAAHAAARPAARAAARAAAALVPAIGGSSPPKWFLASVIRLRARDPEAPGQALRPGHLPRDLFARKMKRHLVYTSIYIGD